MGFALQCSTIAAMTGEEDAQLLRAFLLQNQVPFTEEFDFSDLESDGFFETFAEDDSEDFEPVLAHPEVGWSWWESTQILAAETVGYDETPHLQSIFAWNGVAAPGEFQPEVLGPSEPISPSPSRKPSFLERIGLMKPQKDVHDLMQLMIHRHSGGDGALRIVSSLALERELAAVLAANGLTNTDPMELYESIEEDSQAESARAMATIAHKFVRTANQRGYLVWFRK